MHCNTVKFLFTYTVEIPFTLTFVNNTPHVEGNRVCISFVASKPIYSATCYLGRSLRRNCTSGNVEFTDVRATSYPFRVVALDKERFGHKTIERRTIHVLGEYEQKPIDVIIIIMTPILHTLFMHCPTCR